jgi:CubicO group peptidase (beta-lactamase class C family)
MQNFDRRTFLGAAAGSMLASPLLAAEPAATNSVQSIIDTFVRTSRFNGLIHFVRDGRPVLSQAYGMADFEAARPASIDTLYPLASISKWFTSVTALRLVDQGKLGLDGAISDYLGSYRADTGSRVRLKHLLSNASGIPNLFGPAVTADPGVWTRAFTTGEAIKAFCSGDLAFEPGSHFSYDFTNWIIVKGIIEAVTGEDFAKTVDRLTLSPLGLTTIVPGYDPAARARAAAGYASIDPPVRKMFPQSIYTLAAGGYCGTAPDLVRAAQGVYATRFLSPAALKALTTVLMPQDAYALGGRVKALDIGGASRSFAWETGRVDSYRSLLVHRLDGKASLVVLNNTSIGQRDIDLFAEALLKAG